MLLHTQNFDSGVAAGWAISNMDFVPGYSGLGLSGAGGSATFSFGPPRSNVTAGFRLSLTQNPGADPSVLCDILADVSAASLRLWWNGADVSVEQAGTGFVGFAPLTLDSDWAFVEIQVDSAGALKVRVDGTDVIVDTSPTLISGATGFIGVSLQGSTWVPIFDDFYLSDDLQFRESDPPSNVLIREHDNSVLAAVAGIGRPTGLALPPTGALEDLVAGTGPGYYIVYPIPGGSRDGSVKDPWADVTLHYQITCVDRGPEGARWLSDQLEAALASVTVPNRYVMSVAPTSPSGVWRDDDTAAQPLFSSTPSFRIRTTP